jgi:hypothetical protein
VREAQAHAVAYFGSEHALRDTRTETARKFTPKVSADSSEDKFQESAFDETDRRFASRFAGSV